MLVVSDRRIHGPLSPAPRNERCSFVLRCPVVGRFLLKRNDANFVSGEMSLIDKDLINFLIFQFQSI